MTVGSTLNYKEYSGDGVSNSFTIPFYFILDSDIAIMVGSSAGVVTELTYGTDYSVSGAGDASGGTATLNTVYSSDYTILIYRNPPVTQETAYDENGKFPAKSHEKALDKLTMLIQHYGWTIDSLALTKPNVLASYYNAKGNRIVNLGEPVSDQDAATKHYVDQEVAIEAAERQAADEALQLQRGNDLSRTLRVPENYSLNELQSPLSLRGRLLYFDDQTGQPNPVYPGTLVDPDVLDLQSFDGEKYIGQCPNYGTLSGITPSYDGQKITLMEYTSGTGCGGGKFVAINGTGTEDGGITCVVDDDWYWERLGEPSTFDVTMFGAVPDGETDCIEAIKLMEAWSRTQTDNRAKIGVQFSSGTFAVSTWDSSDTYKRVFRLAGAGSQAYGYNNPTKLILTGDAGSVAFTVQARQTEIINLEVYGQYDTDGTVRGFFKNICTAGQYVRSTNFRGSYIGGRIFQLLDTLDVKFDQFYTEYTYDNIFRVLASGTVSGGWNHSTAFELTNFNIQNHLCTESQQCALFIPNCTQSLIWNGWIEHSTYPGNLTLGQWNIHSLSLESNTYPLYMSQARFMNYLFSNPSGQGIDIDTRITVAYDTGEYSSRSISNYEKGYGEWNTHGLYLNAPVRCEFNATQKYISNITSSEIWVYVGHFFLPTLAQVMNIRVIGRTGYSTPSNLAGIDGSALISIQNRNTTSATVTWHAPRGNSAILDVVFTQPYARDTYLYVKIPAYSRVGFFLETNGLLRKDTGTPTFIDWDMSTVSDIAAITTQDAISTCSLGTSSAGIVADGENNQLYLYSASDVIGELDVLKMGVNGIICNFPYMRGGGWKVPVYYYSTLPAAADNWWTICLCRAFSCANGATYKTQLIFSDGTYWRPLEEPSTYITGSA